MEELLENSRKWYYVLQIDYVLTFICVFQYYTIQFKRNLSDS